MYKNVYIQSGDSEPSLHQILQTHSYYRYTIELLHRYGTIYQECFGHHILYGVQSTLGRLYHNDNKFAKGNCFVCNQKCIFIFATVSEHTGADLA